jgi:hypothetical protein
MRKLIRKILKEQEDFIFPKYENSDEQIFKYLDRKFNGLVKKNAEYYDGIIFTYPDEEYGILGWQDNKYYQLINTLWVDYKILNQISSFFEISDTDSKNILGKWVVDRLQLKVDNIIMLDGPEPRRLTYKR